MNCSETAWPYAYMLHIALHSGKAGTIAKEQYVEIIIKLKSPD